jgi:hypothetical protein
VEQQFAAVRVLFDRLITQGEPRRDRYAPAGQTRVGDELTTLGKA